MALFDFIGANFRKKKEIPTYIAPEYPSPMRRLGEACGRFWNFQLPRDEYLKFVEEQATALGLEFWKIEHVAIRVFDDARMKVISRRFATQMALRKKRGYTA